MGLIYRKHAVIVKVPQCKSRADTTVEPQWQLDVNHVPLVAYHRIKTAFNGVCVIIPQALQTLYPEFKCVKLISER